MGVKSLIGKFFLKYRQDSAYNTIIGLLNTLEQYPEKRGEKLWHRVVNTILEIIQEYPAEVFDRRTSPRAPKEAEKRPLGFLINVVAVDGFTKTTSFVGFIGNSVDGRYGIQFCFYADIDRPKPLFLYSFEVLQKGGNLCKAIAVSQNSSEMSENAQYAKDMSADMILQGKEASAMATTFHILSGISPPRNLTFN